MSASKRAVDRAVLSAQPLLLNNLQCAALMGIGRDRFYELRRSDPNFPKPVEFPGVKKARKQLRHAQDVERYVRGLAQRADRVDSAE